MYTDEELAAHADTTVERVRRMAELRIITPGPEGFGRSDIQLVRVAEAMNAAGIGLDDIGALIAGGHYSMGWGELLYPDPVLTSDRTLEQACAELDVPIAFAQRFFIALGEENLKGVAEPVRLFRASATT